MHLTLRFPDGFLGVPFPDDEAGQVVTIGNSLTNLEITKNYEENVLLGSSTLPYDLSSDCLTVSAETIL